MQNSYQKIWKSGKEFFFFIKKEELKNTKEFLNFKKVKKKKSHNDFINEDIFKKFFTIQMLIYLDWKENKYFYD